MPLTQLDVNAALIVIDLQKGIVERMTALGGDEVVVRAAELVGAFRTRGRKCRNMHLRISRE